MTVPFKKIVEIYRFRGLLWNLVISELRLRYRRSVLGFFWTLLNPLLMMAVLSVVFSKVMNVQTKDYTVQLCAGLVPWTFFSQSVMLALTSIVSKGSLIKQVYVPKAIIPLAAVLATFVNFIFSFIALLLIAAIVGHPLTAAIFFVPVAALLLLLFTLGIALLFACLNVFFRDFGHMTEVLIQALFYASPIIYTLQMIPVGYRGMFTFNPISYLVACFRLPLYDGILPPASTIGAALLSGVVALVLGFGIFARFEKHFVLRV